MNVRHWLGVFVFAVGTVAASAAPLTNSWVASPGGRWDGAANWSLGVAPDSIQAGVCITNAGSKTINIDGLTAAASLTISNCTLGAPGGAVNTLQLTNAGTITPLRVVRDMVIQGGGDCVLSNAALQIGTAGQLHLDGTLTVQPDALLLVTNGLLQVGQYGNGTFNVSGGEVRARALYVGRYSGASGRLAITGGSVTVGPLLMGVGMEAGTTGQVSLDGGSLIVTNIGPVLGNNGTGSLVLSNGTATLKGITVGLNGQGTLTVAGGQLNLSDFLVLGSSATATGTMWLTGGQVHLPDSGLAVGSSGVGQMSLSNGLVRAKEAYVGISRHGRLEVAGGELIVTGQLVVISAAPTATGQVAVVGGQVRVSDGVTYLGYDGVGELLVSNGLYASAGLVAGNCASNAVGRLRVAGGCLAITNASGTAVLEINGGSYEQSGGITLIDRLVMTNNCGLFRQLGGDLSVGVLDLGPSLDADGDGLRNDWEQAHQLNALSPVGLDGAGGDPDGDGQTNLQEQAAGTDPRDATSVLAITAIEMDKTDVRVHWRAMAGQSYVVQTNATPNAAGFADWSEPIVCSGAGPLITNHLHQGGANVGPRLFYRVRLVEH